MKIQYDHKLRLNKENKTRLQVINDIIEDYQDQGYVLTLRQLYYQLVSRDLIANEVKEYAKLSTLLVKGRMAGVVDWDAIEDRIRVPKIPYWVNGIEDAIKDTVSQYRLNRQEDQDIYIEVWVEKDALSGVLSRITKKYHIRLMVNRGYSSATAMHDAFHRFVNYGACKDKKVRILYLGDHDPSGLDMIRDIRERITFFQNNYNDGYIVEEMDFDIDHIALTGFEIEKYNPPPNPAKITDPRAKWYIKKYGDVSYEVDALKPEVLNGLLEDSILDYVDIDKFNSIIKQEKKDINKLKKFIKQ